MLRRSHALRILVCLLVLAVEASCHGQSPSSLGLGITSAVELNDEQRRLVTAYAEYWTAQLTSADSDAEEVEQARQELMRPLRAVGRPSPAFRFEYSTVVVPALEPLLKNDSRPHATLNAAIVLGELASRSALNALIEQSDINRQPDRELRIQASMNVAKALIRFGNDSNVLQPRDLGPLLRGLRRAAENEEDGIVLRHLLRGLQAVNTAEAQGFTIAALESVAEKIEAHEGGVSPLIRPFYEAINRFRATYVTDLSPTEKTEVGRSIGPIIADFFSIVASLWEVGHASEEMRTRAAGPLRTCESFAKLVVVNEGGNPPNTTLRQLWEDGNKEEFSRQVNEWLEVLRRPPFGR